MAVRKERSITRREVLRLAAQAAVAVGALGAVACQDIPGSSDAVVPSPTGRVGSSSTASAEPSATPSPGSQPPPSPSPQPTPLPVASATPTLAPTVVPPTATAAQPTATAVPSTPTRTPTRPPTGKLQWRMTGTAASSLSPFDAIMRSYMSRHGIEGGAVAVTRQGKLMMARGYTWTADPSYAVKATSPFRIASLTKPITATAILRCVQDGRLSLDAKLTTLLRLSPPTGQTEDERLGRVTVRHLLQHTGGWDRDVAFDPMFSDAYIADALGIDLPIKQADIIQVMTGERLQYDPGKRYAYSNYGYLLLGRILEAVTGQPYQDYVRDAILGPLGIRRMAIGDSAPDAPSLPDEVSYHSDFSEPSVFSNSLEMVPLPYGGFNLRNMDSHGGWVASAVELVRFATMFDKTFRGSLLSSRSIETMFARPSVSPKDAAYYGCGWMVRPFSGTRNTWHVGSLPGCYTLMVRRWDGLDWVVLLNRRDSLADPSGNSFGEIDDLMHKAADAVKSWPTQDLFSRYL